MLWILFESRIMWMVPKIHFNKSHNYTFKFLVEIIYKKNICIFKQNYIQKHFFFISSFAW